MVLPSLIKMDFPRKKRFFLVTLQIIFLSSWRSRYTDCPGKHWIRQNVAINLISFHIASVSFPLFLFSSVWPPGSRHEHVAGVTQVTFSFCCKVFSAAVTRHCELLLAHPRQGQLQFRSPCCGDGSWPAARGDRGSQPDLHHLYNLKYFTSVWLLILDYSVHLLPFPHF